MNRRRFLGDERASTLAEFALTLPLLMTFLFAIIDGGRYLYQRNKIEKATQMGVRMAVVTSPVATGLTSMTFSSVTPGETIPASALSDVKCRDTGACTCTGNCPTSLARDDVAFTRIYDRMKLFYPALLKNNVEVVYSGSGIGYAGDPDTTSPDVKPVVTVRIRNDSTTDNGKTTNNGIKFIPLTGYGWAEMTMPAFQSSLTAEDLLGTQSN